MMNGRTWTYSQRLKFPQSAYERASPGDNHSPLSTNFLSKQKTKNITNTK